MPGEAEIISRIKQRARATDQVLIGIGDDAAVLRHGGTTDLIACCDLMAEGVHFRREWAAPRLIGHKALAVTLSDVAAMGGVARFAMISMALPHTLSPGFIEELFEGIFELADSSGVSVMGGDTSSSVDSLFIDTSAQSREREQKSAMLSMLQAHLAHRRSVFCCLSEDSGSQI
jgi:thiamine-monophosphate kinase